MTEEYDIVSFAIAKALKRARSGYSLTICKEGILISKGDLYDPDVPVEDVVLSKAERDFIMRCFAEGVSIAYDSIIDASVMAAGKKRTPRQLTKEDFDAIRKHFEQTDDRASTEVNNDATAPYRGAFTTPNDGCAVVCMLIRLTKDAAIADIEKGLDVHAFNITDAEALFNVPVHVPATR